MSMMIDLDPWGALRLADRAVKHAPAEQRYLTGLAMTLRRCGLQATGQTAEAVRWLTAAFERDEDQMDVRTIRTVLSLMLVHRHDGNFWASEAAARQMLTLAERHDLPAAAGSALGYSPR